LYGQASPNDAVERGSYHHRPLWSRKHPSDAAGNTSACATSGLSLDETPASIGSDEGGEGSPASRCGYGSAIPAAIYPGVARPYRADASCRYSRPRGGECDGAFVQARRRGEKLATFSTASTRPSLKSNLMPRRRRLPRRRLCSSRRSGRPNASKSLPRLALEAQRFEQSPQIAGKPVVKIQVRALP
jgi:hypothetical protein